MSEPKVAPPSAPPVDDFLHRQLPVLRKRVFRLGITASYGLDPAGLREALEGKVNYLFAWNLDAKGLRDAVRDVVARDRERYVVTSGPMLGYFAGSIRRAAESALRALGSDYLDILQLFWAGRMSALTQSNLAELRKLREEGKVRAVGVSIHDRPRAGRLVEESDLDLFMIRYNAAHPGAEKDIFPHLAKRRPMMVAYTATSWRKLLARPKGWDGPVATASDCYRFCLSSPHIDVTLCGPKNVAQLREDLAGVEKGPLGDDAMKWMRDLGHAVHG